MSRRAAAPPPPVSRVGKIAQLPYAVREELNARLRDGHTASALIGWLNALPEVKERLATYYAGRPINAENLSNWRGGGYAEWFRGHAIRREGGADR